MRCLSRIDIEAIAEKYIQAYMRIPEVRDTHIYKIDPELFLEKVLKLDIRYLHLSNDGSMLGLTTFEQIEVAVITGTDVEEHILLDGNTVLIESDLKSNHKLRGRMNFTLMHEGSHQIFKKLFPDDYGAVSNRESAVHYHKASHGHCKQIEDWEEWQANTLASAILLPPNLIYQGMYLFGLGEKIECLNKIYKPKEYERFSALADFLGCSKKALAIRMKQLGLIKNEYLDNPFGMIKVYM